MEAQKNPCVRHKPPILTYVVSYPGLGLVEIGQAQYYANRLGNLRTGSPVEPVPVCAFVGAHHERELHQLCAHLRHRLEYFKDAPELREHLERRPGRITHEEAMRLSPPLARSSKRPQIA